MTAGGQPDKSDPRFWNRPYRNNGDGTFTDVTAAAGVRGSGYGMGVAAADYDNDGYTDLYVTGVNGNTLYHNNGDGAFTDVTEKAGVRGCKPKPRKCTNFLEMSTLPPPAEPKMAPV